MLTSIKKVISSLVVPRSRTEDDKRKEFILNVILISSFLLSALVTLLLLIRSIQTHSLNSTNGVSFLMGTVIFVVFLTLYILSRAGLFKLSAYLLLTIYFITATYALYAWGIDLPQGLLVYAMIIVASGILINSTFAFIVTLCCSATLFILNYLIQDGTIKADQVWRQMQFGWPDAIVISVTFGVVAVISWLSNREIDKSLKRARKSEAELKKERDLLEIKVEERTAEIKKVQLEKMSQMAHFAEIGRLTSGVFHDLINPLTAVSLNLEKLNKTSTEEWNNSKKNIKYAIQSTKLIQDLMNSLKNQISQQEIKQNFSINKTIKDVIQIVSYKARLARVEIETKEEKEISFLHGNPLKFHQALSNLISNAIDAYDQIKSNNHKKIELRLTNRSQDLLLEIQDWGKGMSTDSIEHIFDPFFTTKPTKGMGLGLAITKNIIEQDFDGTISIESNPDFGTTIKIKLPRNND
jgi:signal transduction histidine kinase